MADVLALGMFAASCGFLLLGYPVAFTLAGTALLFAGIGHFFGVFDFALLGALVPQIFGRMTNPVLIAVPLFVFMGVMLERSKVAEDLLETMGLLFGRLPRRPRHLGDVVGALLAASTGIVGATVVTMGLLSLPTMLKRGYDPKLATGRSALRVRSARSSRPRSCWYCWATCCPRRSSRRSSSAASSRPRPCRSATCSPAPCCPGLVLVAFYILYQIAVAWLRPELAARRCRRRAAVSDRQAAATLSRAAAAARR